ncbi:MAG: XRE family transcriptional regulator [Microcystis wesenbergii Mw_MB_S_20031200_S109]|uniref:XRE family transcriptional regulator n=1 Tax=Microcystis wesenbergii Mw_MB_S_20031200_S109D TaxID=2486241 RepID=A0A552LL96_9CHRO|nr:MAG: XRE family transcriptional regulator [Microcystis wesenbergii Mw_MB_S_20031200_S109]TRV20976.1 MAG: XRE family transcriptional regulator [Microcystis wesenbergii Mw_MB_S_20031200_S109D]
MSNLVIERSNTFGSINPQKRFRMIPGIAESSTIGYDNLAAQKLLAISERTNSEIVVPKHNPHLFQDSQKAINELRKTSGLTWEQVAKLFNVSRRSIHFWASGQTLASDNEEKLNRLLGVIRYIDRGSASLNRKLLLNPNADGELPLDQLISGEYDKVRENLGRGNPLKRPQLTPLSEEESELRRPLPPEILIDALQDSIHHDVGRSRPAKTLRSGQNRSGKQTD